MSDVNVRGQVRVLATILGGPAWRDVWAELNLGLFCFREFELDDESPDSLVWEVCQREEVILITANRNEDGPDSLQATLQARNDARSLPVLTLADSRRVLASKDYAERVAERLLEYLIDIDLVRGTGRLYLP